MVRDIPFLSDSTFDHVNSLFVTATIAVQAVPELPRIVIAPVLALVLDYFNDVAHHLSLGGVGQHFLHVVA